MKRFILLFLAFAVICLSGCAASPSVSSDTVENTDNIISFDLVPADNGINGRDKLNQSNYPRIGYTKFCEPIAQGIFVKSFKSADEERPLSGHRLYPHSASEENEIISKLKSSELDIGIIMTPSSALTTDPELEYTLIGIDTLVFLTSSENPVRDIDRNCLKKTLSYDRVHTWTELSNGGYTSESAVNIAGEFSFKGGKEILSTLILDGGQPVRSIDSAYYTQITGTYEKTFLGNFRGDFGYVLDYTPLFSFLGYLSVAFDNGDTTRLLTVNGEYPLADGALNSDYPYCVDLYFVQKKGTQNEAVGIIKNYFTSQSDNEYDKLLIGAGVSDDIHSDFIKEIYDKLID